MREGREKGKESMKGNELLDEKNIKAMIQRKKIRSDGVLERV